MTIEKIEHNGKIFALIIRSKLEIDGVNFFTPKDYPFQIGLLKHKKGYEIKPHIHKPSNKIINGVQEVLHIEYGKVEVYFYSDNGEKIASNILNTGDTILLITGGHGFKIKEDSKIIEVKQGPYQGFEKDKEHLEVKNDSSM